MILKKGDMVRWKNQPHSLGIVVSTNKRHKRIRVRWIDEIYIRNNFHKIYQYHMHDADEHLSIVPPVIAELYK